MLLSAWPMVAKRGLAHWRPLSAVVVGVVLASAIMAGTVIYFDSLREVALRKELRKHSPTDLDIVVSAGRGPTSRQEYQRVARRVTGEFESRVGWLLKNRIHGGKTATFFLTTPGNEQKAGQDNARAYFAFHPGLEEHITLLPGGRLPTEGRGESPTPSPQSLAPSPQPLILEAIIPSDAAELFGVGVGDMLSAVPHWDDGTPYASVVISGVFEPKIPLNPPLQRGTEGDLPLQRGSEGDLSLQRGSEGDLSLQRGKFPSLPLLERGTEGDLLWQLDSKVFQASTSGSFRTVPFYVSEQTFMDTLGGAFRQMDSTYGWFLDVDTDRLNAGNATGVRLDILTMRSRLLNDFISYRQITSLDAAIASFDQRLLFTKLQMFVVLIVIAVVVLFYVVSLSSLLVEQQRGEISLLRSRGASSAQVLAVFMLEGATIAILAVVVSPLLAAMIISFLGYVPAFSDLSGGARLPVSLTLGAYMMSALGGILSFAALMFPAVQASRIGVVRHKQESARPSRQPFFQRYYLDVILLVASLLLFRQLTEQGSAAATGLLGEVVVNQLLLAAPALTLVAAAMVLLRLFPLAMEMVSRLLSPGLPPGMVMGLWQMARNPTHYARLSLLLILMAGLGIFAASFGGTLDRSFRERVLYATGSDIRLEGLSLNFSGFTKPLTRSYETIPGVAGVSPALRAPGLDLSADSGSSFVLLAVDSASFADVAWARDDFAGRPMPELMRSLKHNYAPPGLPLPGNARAIGALLKADRPHPGVVVTARLRDSNGRHLNYTLGNLQSGNWGLLEIDLFESRDFRRGLFPSPPLTLVSLTIHETNSQAGLQPGSILIDDIRSRRATGEVEIIEDFNDVRGWNVLRETPQAMPDVIQASDASARGDGALVFNWTGGSALTERGIFPGPPLSPVPALASKSFMRATGHALGEEIEVSVGGRRLPVRLVDAVDFFPTLDTLNQSFLIADVSPVVSYGNMAGLFSELTPNEVWLSTSVNGAERTKLIERLRSGQPFRVGSIRDRDAELAASHADPLVKAGWRALLFIAFAAILALSSIGFLVHAYVSFRNRQVQFALMRTIGFSMKGLTVLILLEQALVVGVGMGLGTWMGGRLGATIMPFLGHDDRGAQVLPPFVIEVNWVNLALTYAAMAMVFGIITFSVIWAVRKMALSRVLRLGEM
jgi:hypothetical protein